MELQVLSMVAGACRGAHSMHSIADVIVDVMVTRAHFCAGAWRYSYSAWTSVLAYVGDASFWF